MTDTALSVSETERCTKMAELQTDLDRFAPHLTDRTQYHRLHTWASNVATSLAFRYGELAQLRADLAAARSLLREAQQDSERLDWFAGWTKGDAGICPPGNHGGDAANWLVYREDNSRGDRQGRWCEEYEAPTLREAIDSALPSSPTPATGEQD